MQLNLKSIQNREWWRERGIALPEYDLSAMRARTRANPTWIHFGAGNLFRAYIARMSDALLNAGYFSNAGLILFGHTHVAMHEELEGTHILNPGSAGMGARCTYGLVTIEDGQVVSCAVLPVPVS